MLDAGEITQKYLEILKVSRKIKIPETYSAPTPNCFFNLGNSFSHSCFVKVDILIGEITPDMNLAPEDILLSCLIQNS